MGWSWRGVSDGLGQRGCRTACVSIMSPSGSQPLSGSVHEVVDGLVEVQGDSSLVVLQWFQGLVLRGDEAWWHEMVRAGCHTVGDDALVAGQMDEDDAGACCAQLVTVAALEGRAGRHGTWAVVVGQPRSDGSQPRSAVLVGEGEPLGHFGDVRCRVQVVPVEEGKSECVGQLRPDDGLSSTAHSHDDDGWCDRGGAACGCAHDDPSWLVIVDSISVIQKII